MNDYDSNQAWLNYQSQQQPPKKPRNNKPIIIGGVFAFLVLVGIVAATTDSSSKTDSAGGSSTTATKADEKSTDAKKSTKKKESAPKDVKFETMPGAGQVFATFEVEDNLTKGLRSSGAKQRTVEILKYAQKKYPNAPKIIVQGTADTVDAYGGENEDTIILNVGYDAATMDRFNFDNVDQDKIWQLRDQGMVNSNILDN